MQPFFADNPHSPRRITAPPNRFGVPITHPCLAALSGIILQLSAGECARRRTLVKGTPRLPSPVGHLVSFLGVIVIIPYGLFGRMCLKILNSSAFKHLCSIQQWPKGQKHYVHPNEPPALYGWRICEATDLLRCGEGPALPCAFHLESVIS